MCPACAATVLLIAGATSTGGLAAWIVNFFRRRRGAAGEPDNCKGETHEYAT